MFLVCLGSFDGLGIASERVPGALFAFASVGIAMAASGNLWQAHFTMTPGYAQLPVQHLDGGNANGGEDLYVNGQVWTGTVTNQATGVAYPEVFNIDQMFAINPYFSSALFDSGTFTLTQPTGGKRPVCQGTIALHRDHRLLGANGYFQGIVRFDATPKTCPLADSMQLVWGTDTDLGNTIDLQFLER